MNRVKGVDCRSGRSGAGRLSFVLSVGMALFVIGAGSPATASTLVIEPGVPVADGFWLVPLVLVDGGVGLEVDAAAVEVCLDGEMLRDFELKPFAPKPGGEASAVAVLLGEAGTGLPAGAASVLEAFLDEAGAGALRGLYVCGDDLEIVKACDGPAPKLEALTEILARRGPVRLWDGLLASLELLSLEDLPERRALLVIADGGEEIESEHPQATCVEAAKLARVAVHVLIVPGNEAGGARLTDLARRSGGSVSMLSGTVDIRRSLAVVDRVRGLWLETGARELPGEVKITLDQGGGVTGTARVVERLRLGGGPSRLWPLLVVVLVVLGAGLLLWRHRRRAGVLVLKENNGVRRMEIPHGGVTVGTNADNTLVLENQCVSRHHAVIRTRGSEVIITDLRSTNGTQVNDRLLRTAILRDGDRILLGGAVEITYYRDSGRGRK